ncbi:MAG: hypothetical protein R3A11_09620 [Bdellovibrionota bacterium]
MKNLKWKLFEACANRLDLIQFEEGQFKLIGHEDGSKHLNQSSKCDDDHVKIKTTEHFPGSPSLSKNYTWKPAVNPNLDLNIPGLKTDGLHLISAGIARYVKCTSFSSKLSAALFGTDSNGIPNLFKFDGRQCSQNDITEFTTKKSQELTFKLHFQADPNLYLP